ncbi:DNA polymerase epsilon catalytic subunit [Fasciola gigantica]|uniref:DNA polymerase epsilon catalytic subunit n=1 Tax=Fasciola gigantica TaxID=46835 RepID=A0A504Y699_FASGI|nr:DNA polymerase epsilon catalytic subunit [Fasciola gigantica]
MSTFRRGKGRGSKFPTYNRQWKTHTVDPLANNQNQDAQDTGDLGGVFDPESVSSASNEMRFTRAKANDISDRRYGFEPFVGPGERIGWLLNMHPTDVLDESKRLVSAVDFYFIREDGSRFKVTRPYLPYFFLSIRGGTAAERDATTYLLRRYSGRLAGVETVQKEDLDLPNHLVGLKASYLKLLFHSVDELVRVRRELAIRVRANCELASTESTYTNMLAEHFSGTVDLDTGNTTTDASKNSRGDPLDNLMDIRESDVPYLMRVCIDLSVFAGCWYVARCRPSQPVELIKHEDTVAWPEPVVLAFDIETTKLPLKFPDSSVDQIMMISYMLDGAGYLICNREIISEDVADFEFTPRPEFPGHFKVHNMPTELDCITVFFEHIQRVRPNVIVTYNGDMFDWPFIEARAAHYGLSMSEEIAFSRQKSTAGPGRDGSAGEYLSRPVVHIDCLCWVKRDSYLPVGARGLKAVAKAKLRYDPIEVDPEAMCRMAREAPRVLASYSVSDAVATYYLYMKYVHPFVFALCTILPLNPDGVLRKGSGTLCEALLMVQAYAANVVFPHKQTASGESGPAGLIPGGSNASTRFTEDGKLIDSETYVGGHVEALEAGVFRADIPVRFRLVPAALEALRKDVRRCLKKTLQTEVGAEDEEALESLIPEANFDKVWKRRYDEACAAVSDGTGDSGAVKEANAMLVLYDSLQLAHKCILNSFYGYVMRRGARWHSMEMAGIVCHTGANIITRAREIIEQVGRALELDTDGIWCILPASFPQNLEFKTTSAKPSRVSISYPGAILNIMVQDLFTNDQYHELVDPASLTYKVRSENSIFFEVDGPYKAMVLPAAKEEGKRLKKRYAVFNFDGSLAELKGFEIKRNGELQLIKIFQSSVFEAFLRGRTLTEVYASVASVADHWLDVLYSKGADMPDSELFDLISENRSMSRRLEDYGAQKSTSISTARRMAEFLGDQIVKDAGLSCRFVISKKPDGAPVTERAIPLTIFQAEPSVKRHYLRKWLKDSSLDESTDLREILDWSYYIERLGSAIQKIITIPAALQQIPNPVSRVSHPDWLLRRLSDKTDTCKQRKLTDMMSLSTMKLVNVQSAEPVADIEDLPSAADTIDYELAKVASVPVIVRNHPSEHPVLRAKRTRSPSSDAPPPPWREQMGEPPRLEDANSHEKLLAWLTFHQAKWKLQAERRRYLTRQKQSMGDDDDQSGWISTAKRQRGMERYLAQTRLNLCNSVWQIVEITSDPGQPGKYTMWILIDSPNSNSTPSLQTVSLLVPRRFYVNLRTPKPNDSGPLYRKVAGVSHASASTVAGTTSGAGGRLLPRSHRLFHLYEYTVPEDVYAAHATDIAADLARPDVEGVYELNMPSLFRALVRLGCLCRVDRETLKMTYPGASVEDMVFHLDQLRFCSLAQHPYLSTNVFRHVFLFHFQQPSPGPVTTGRRDATRQLYLLVIPWTASGYVCVIDSARVNQLPDLSTLYTRQRTKLISDSPLLAEFPPESLNFEVRVETDLVAGRRVVQRWLAAVRQVKRTETAGSSSSAASSNTSTTPTAPVLVLLHASVPASVTSVEINEVGWPLGDTMTARRRAPQLTALAGFPVVPLAGTMDESDLQTGEMVDPGADAYSLLNWQQTAIKRGIRYFIQSEARFERQLELARYLHVPVANLPVSEAPAPITISQASSMDEVPLAASPIAAIELGCDLFYARHLTKQNHILWCSPTGCPDLGGKETDDQRLLLEMEETGVIEVNHPGSYPHVSVELELSNLAVNTLLVASRIPELEGATSLTFDRLSATERPLEEQINQGLNLGANITSYDETAACSAAFRVLRFLSSNLTLVLYCPVTARSIGVHAALVENLVDGKDIEWGEGEPQQQPQTNKDSDDDEGQENATGWGNPSVKLPEPEIDMHWHIARYLPETRGLRTKFQTLLAGYLLAVYNAVRDEHRRTRRLKMTTQLLDTVDMDRRLDTDVMLPLLPSPASTDSLIFTPLLDFIKSICEVLSLDRSLKRQVSGIRRDLLRLIGVGEFSSEAVWIAPHLIRDQPLFTGDNQDSDFATTNPIRSLLIYLPEVACPVCNFTRDIDVCRDTHLIRLVDTTESITGYWAWICPHCRNAYPRARLEEELVQQLEQIALQHCLQDLQCTKCLSTGGIQETLLARGGSVARCSDCSHRLSLTVPVGTAFLKRFDVYRAVGAQFGFPVLEQSAFWMLCGLHAV